MTVYDADTIDRITTDDGARKVYLGLVIPGPFQREPDLIKALTAKVNAYVRFVKSGQLGRQHPNLAQHVPYIEIAHAGPPDGPDLSLIERLGGQLANLGIGLRTVDLDKVD